MMKKTMLLIASFFLVNSVFAQVNDDFGDVIFDFQRFRDSIFGDFEEFRRQANEEYAHFMEQPWKPFEAKPAMAPPVKPKPPKPVVAPPETHPTANPIPFDGKPVQAQPIDRPQPIEPIPLKPCPQDQAQTVYFFNTPMRFHYDKSHSLKLDDVSEKSVAKLWTQLAEPYYDNLISECLQCREAYSLCDWAYINLTKLVAEACCRGHTNEAVVMHMYLLTQSGYQMRLGRADDRLFVLVGTQERIFRYKYFVLDGVKYYNFDRETSGKGCYIYDHAFPKEKVMSLALSKPKLSVERTEPRKVTSKRYSSAEATVETNKNLIDFYDSYPITADWQYYSTVSLSETAKATLYPALRNAIAGKSQAEAANILINFVQTGLDYATDDEQFGYERPLFPDESLYYPYCDCEDRSILFACLVRELLGLDAVLLDYPEHLATAVHFTDDVTGDYLTLDGKKYLVCDPTYIGASIGMCMPGYKEVAPNVVRIP